MNESPDEHSNIYELSEEDGQPLDNIESAMDKVASTLRLSRKKNTNTKDGETAQKQVMVRATDEDHERWKQCSDHLGISMAEFIRSACNDKYADVMMCRHPLEFRKTYPWREDCLKCGAVLRNGDGFTYIRSNIDK